MSLPSAARAGLAALMLLAALPVFADDLAVSEARIRHMPADLPMGGFFTLANNGGQSRRLVGASSEAYGALTIHQTLKQDDQMRMMHADAVEIAPGDQVRFAPGGYHLMLTKRSRDIRIGEQVTVALEFADGERVEAEFEVQPPSARGH